MRRLLVFVLILASSCVAQPAKAQNNCADQVFRGTTLQVTSNHGATYNPTTNIARAYLQTIYACPITSAVTLGQYQAVGFMADQIAMVIYASPDFRWYYVHREWRVYALTAAQWRATVVMVNVKVGH